MVLDLLCGRGADEAGDGKRVHTLGLQLRELFAADLQDLAEVLLGSVGLDIFFSHDISLLLLYIIQLNVRS